MNASFIALATDPGGFFLFGATDGKTISDRQRRYCVAYDRNQ